ncbi:MAG TPA: Gfo/Idh/MocA family oxidoreductase [Planctomycetota bacterium]|nr:Gfo/Idh/MocA family oxidoreductase [Planctomycetota bacterium]
MTKKINIAIVGLGFGAEFIPIYQKHPHTNMYAICQRTNEKLDKIGDTFGIEKRYTAFEDLINDPSVDAVHINSPIHMHASQSIAALKAGKHVACTVPMATTVKECQQIVAAQKAAGKKYMMMETTVYSREFLHVKELRDTGKLGRLQFLRAAHHQEMQGWPGYWEGLPPMHYATHCVGPCLALAQRDADYVSCLGSGRIDEMLIPKYGSPFAVETCHIKLRDSDLSAEITRSLFNTAREYVESFDAYGSKMTFEWQQTEKEEPVVFRGERAERVKVPDYAKLLPEPIQRFTTKGVYDADDHQHLSFIQGGGHGGSHPHLAHEFVMSIVEDRQPFPNGPQSANWTCVGILAHDSAMKGGEIQKLPEFS